MPGLLRTQRTVSLLEQNRSYLTVQIEMHQALQTNMYWNKQNRSLCMKEDDTAEYVL